MSSASVLLNINLYFRTQNHNFPLVKLSFNLIAYRRLISLSANYVHQLPQEMLKLEFRLRISSYKDRKWLIFYCVYNHSFTQRSEALF